MSSSRGSVAIRAVSKVFPRNHAQFLDPQYGIALSNLDQIFSEAYPQLVFFYESHYTSPSDIVSLMQSLKESLAMVLEVYPVVAGRVRPTKQQGRQELVLQPEDGLVFLEATTEAKLDDWPDLRQCSLLPQLNPNQNTNLLSRGIEEAPMAQVQITVFKCGGVALGFSFAHIMTDGMGAVQFLKAWGEIHQGQRPSITPLLDRTIIKARDPPQLTVPIPDTTSSFMLQPPNPKQLQASPTNELTSMHVLRMRVSDAKVSECVKEVERGPFAYGSATSNEAVFALVWSSLTRARGWSSDQEESRFSFPINIRSRCDPPIPAGYIGNAILLCYVVANSVSIATHHISYAAKLIHDTIKSHTAAFCQSAIDWMELQRLQNAKSLRLHFKYSEALDCNTWVGFPIYEVNFGWGKPLLMSQALIPTESKSSMGTALWIMPSPEGGRSRDLMIICFNQKQLDALLNDPIFLPFRDPKTDFHN